MHYYMISFTNMAIFSGNPLYLYDIQDIKEFRYSFHFLTMHFHRQMY